MPVLVICVMTFFIKCNKILYDCHNTDSSHFNADCECFVLECWQILVTNNLLKAAWTAGSWQYVQQPVWDKGIPWCAFFCLCAIIFRNVTPMINEELMYNKNYIICTDECISHKPTTQKVTDLLVTLFQRCLYKTKKWVSLIVFKQDILLDIYEHVCPNK